MSCLYNIFFKTNKVVCLTCEKTSQNFHYENCPICLNKYCEKTSLLLPCGHCFHTPCILKWFEKQMNCPICRREFKWVLYKREIGTRKKYRSAEIQFY